jgi:hypothetical protein
LWNIIPYIYFSLSIFLSCVLSSSFYSTNRRGIFSMISSQMPTLQLMDLKFVFLITVGIFISIQIYYLARIRYNLDVEDIRFNLGNLGVEDMEFLD